MSLECVVGIDIGTTSTRVTIYDISGNLITEGRALHEAEHPFPGWAEQDAEELWNSVCLASKKALNQFSSSVGVIKGVSVTSMRQSFVCLGEDLNPLRPAILWYDTRHAAQVDWVRSKFGSKAVYRETGSPPGRRAIYKVMWLKENQPSVYQATRQIAFIPDFIVLRLTGELVTTPGTSFASGCLNVKQPTLWAEEFIENCGIDVNKWIQEIQLPRLVIGTITTHAAAQTGFPAGIPVVLSAGDQACGNLGVGVCQPGMIGINGGTSCALQTPSEGLPIDEEMSFFVDFNPAGYYIAENGVTSGTAALTEWFRDGFGQPEVGEASDEDELWDSLYDLATEAPAGNLGLLLVPYFRGANGPLWDPRARGVMVGLMTDHSRPHLMRALLEGLAYESRQILESMEKGTGVPIHSVRSYGGASHSPIWNQIFADVLHRPVAVTSGVAPVTLGAAIAAGCGVGLYPNPIEAAESMVVVRTIYEPNEQRSALYDELYNKAYVHIYKRVMDLIDTISRVTTHSPAEVSVKR
jgi:sugar (pentulose or hexulose) kinase